MAFYFALGLFAGLITAVLIGVLIAAILVQYGTLALRHVHAVSLQSRTSVNREYLICVRCDQTVRVELPNVEADLVADPLPAFRELLAKVERLVVRKAQ
jgi:hypothetical protein